MQKNSFVKSHGLGNDYIVFDSEAIDFIMTEKNIRRICDVHYGIGSDGILLKVPSVKADFGLRIFNPDGSEAEKSGNGLRIFCKYLFDYGYSNSKIFSVDTLGGLVSATILEERDKKARVIKIDMGKATFISTEIPVKFNKTECLDEVLMIDEKTFIINCVSVGNPHCVVIVDTLNVDEIMKYGPIIEKHAMFPSKINVQFAKKISDKEVEILIWERGAGYTLASGSSSCAVACVMRKKGLTGNDVNINMPGGKLKISINDNWDIQMTGEVQEIGSGVLSKEIFE